MSLLEITDLRSGYGRLPILHGVSLAVEEGEIVAIFGPNGAGKSTLAKTMMGLLPTTSGSIRFDGRDLTRPTTEEIVALGIGYAPQEANTFSALTVEENIAIGLPRGDRARAGGTTAQTPERIYALFPQLAERRRQRAGTLSGGERQMLAIAGAVALQPRLLILDEPTSGLAPIVVDALIASMLAFRDDGTTILWIVGDEAAKALRHVRRAFLLQSGVVEHVLEADRLHAADGLTDLYFGAAEGAPAEGTPAP